MNGVGIKSIPLSELTEEAWTYLTGGSREKTEKLYKQVAWLYGVQWKRASAAAGLPVYLTRNGEDIDLADWPFRMDLASMLRRYSLAMDLYGANYLFKVMRGSKVEKLRWFNPSTITPEVNSRRGLVAFTRRIGDGKPDVYPVKDDRSDIIWTWLDGMQETGPGTPPADVVKEAAEILRYMALTSKGFFERGAVDNWQLFTNYQFPTVEQENNFIQRWRRKMFGGQDKGKQMLILDLDSRIERLNSPIAEWTLPDLNALEAETICIAHHTPYMLMKPESGADKAMMEIATLSWTNSVIIPHAQTLVDTLNDQLFVDYGLEMVIRGEELNVNQEEEHRKSASAVNYTNAIIAALDANAPEIIDIVAATLGIELPEDAAAILAKLKAEKDQRAAEMVESLAQSPTPEDSDEDDSRREEEMKQLKNFLANGTHHKRLFDRNHLEAWEVREAIEQHEYERYNRQFETDISETYRP